MFDKGYSIKIAESRCLNQRHHGVACNQCKRHCPADTILLDQDHVSLNKENCNGCGLCFSDCPTQVFNSSQWDETSLVENIQKQGWKITEFFCGNHSSPYQDHKSPARGALQIPACLSIITRGGWYELGLKTQIELHLEQCEGCSRSKTIPRLEFNIATASEWLMASGHTPEFSFIHQGAKGKVEKSLKAIETGFKITSRRDLFLSLINRGRQVAGQMPDSRKSFSQESDPARRGSCLPDWQRRLAEVYSKNSLEGASPAYWPTVKINSQCVHCGMCSLFCPSFALQSVVQEGRCTYSFNSGLCLDCRICQLVCEKGAISRDREKNEKPFEMKSIFSAPVIECERCGSVTPDPSTPLCYWCGTEKASDYAFKDVCRELFNH